MAWGQRQEIAEHTLVDQSSLCVRCLGLCTLICVPRTSVTDILCKQLFERSNKSLVVHQPTLRALWVCLGTSTRFPQMSTYGQASSLVGGLEEEVDCKVCGGALTLPFTDFPSKGTSSEVEAGKPGDSPTVGSEEEAAMLPSGSERGSSSSKRRGEVDGGGHLGLEAWAGGDSPGSQQFTSPSHPFS